MSEETVANDDNWTILLVDDEQPSRLALSTLIRKQLPDSMLVEAVDAEAALRCSEKVNIDIAFVDIDMPGQNGIELAYDLLSIDQPPLIIFATASNEHAVSAFELNAVDYVVKPFTESRVTTALSRAKSTLSDQTLRRDYVDSTRTAVDQSGGAIKKLWTERANGGRVLIGFSEIGWASARDKEVYVKTAKEELRLRMTLNELDEKLPEDTFIRIHRSHIVNINLAREVIPWDSHSMTLVMGDVDKTELPVSRKYVKQLKAIAGW